MVLCTVKVLAHDFAIYYTDPPEVFIDDTTTPAVEYSTRNLTCRISGGNPSDPKSYDYQWMYRPTYLASDTDIPSPYGMSFKIMVT